MHEPAALQGGAEGGFDVEIDILTLIDSVKAGIVDPAHL